MPNLRASGLILYRCRSVVEFLLLQTSYGEHHWTPPKGHLDPGEDELTAAVRETDEESGIKCHQYKIDDDCKQTITYNVKGKEKVVSYWLAEVTDSATEVKLSDEHQDFRWCHLEEAVTLAKYKDLQRVLKQGHEYILQKAEQQKRKC